MYDSENTPKALLNSPTCANKDSSSAALQKIADLKIQRQMLQEYNNELDESINHYATTFDQSPIGHVILDPQGLITHANLTIASLVEMPVTNMIGLPFTAFIIKDQYLLFLNHLRSCKTSQTRVSTDLTLATCSRRTYDIQLISVPCKLQGKHNFCYNTTIVDISHQKQLEKEIHKMDRLNLIGEMAAGIAHEIRNPMTTVHGYLQLFKIKSSNQQKTEDLQLMLDELERANSIITEFLSLTKNKQIELSPKSLNNIVLALHPLFQAEALMTGKEIFLELFPYLPDVLLDKKQIQQVLFNLVKNGLQAMVRGQLTIRTFVEHDNVVLAIEDQGSGIPDDIKDKICTPFFSTKENGTGIGLGICYSIVQRHNAKLDFKTSPYGTTFFIRFPQNMK